MSFVARKPVVVFVHGLWMNGLELTWLRRQVSKAGFEALQFFYPTVRRDLARNAESLFHFVRDLDARELHLVGYSLGGIVTLNMLARFHAQLPPGRVVLLGSPVAGSNAARGMAKHPLGEWMLGKAAQDCLLGNHASCWHGERECGVIAGTRSVGLGRWFGDLSVPNDGTVAVEETRLDHECARLELPLTHATLMFSRLVAHALAVFLASGKFPDGEHVSESAHADA